MADRQSSGAGATPPVPEDAAAPRSGSASAPAPTSVRRIKVVAAIFLALGALAFWGSSRLTWATVHAGDGMSPERYLPVKGADWSPWLTPLALVLVAAILAAFSLRGWGLRILAVLVAAGGLLAAFPALSVATGSPDSLYAARAIDLSDRFAVRLTTTNGWVAVIVLAGTLCCVAAAILLLRSASGAGLSSKYRTPGARRAEVEREIFADYERRSAQRSAGSQPSGPQPNVAAPDSAQTESAVGDRGAADTTAPPANERMMWDALDTGIDPTDPGER